MVVHWRSPGSTSFRFLVEFMQRIKGFARVIKIRNCKKSSQPQFFRSAWRCSQRCPLSQRDSGFSLCRLCPPGRAGVRDSPAKADSTPHLPPAGLSSRSFRNEARPRSMSWSAREAQYAAPVAQSAFSTWCFARPLTQAGIAATSIAQICSRPDWMTIRPSRRRTALSEARGSPTA